MYHRFQFNHKPKKTHIKLLCTILLTVCMISTLLMSSLVSKSETDNAAALSFPASTQFMEQLDTKFSMRFFPGFSAQETTGPNEPRLLYPGGQPVGILLRTEGILVVGYSPVQTEQKDIYPAESAGIQAGDVIISVNDKQVVHDDELAMLVNQLGTQGSDITLEIQRQNRTLNKTVSPVYCEETDSYRIGLLVRDNAGGVGTLTFVEPATMQYGALGHMIANSDTQRKLNILNGKLVAANIHGIKKGISGIPGEKIGQFVSNDALGTIEQNTAAGIFGTLLNREILSQTVETKPLQIADASEVQSGSAVIYTALNGTQVQAFTVEIEKIMPSARDGKSLVIRVTDPILLERTGGIVQGMSGSPIIQNEKIVGAVTHVFINDPTRGYGILIRDMLDELS